MPGSVIMPFLNLNKGQCFNYILQVFILPDKSSDFGTDKKSLVKAFTDTG
jgi:hypothetical protein